MSGPGPRPPALSRRLLEWSSRRLGTPELADDAAELFADEGSRHGARAARRWYRRQMRAALGRALLPVGRGRTPASGARIQPSATRVIRGAVPGSSSLDVKLALRMLVRQPGLTLVAILALAIGIPVGLLPVHVLGSLSKPLPVEDGEEVVLVRNYDRAESAASLRPLHDFERWREDLSTVDDLGIWRTDVYNVVASDGQTAPVRAAEVTASVFTLLRVRPLVGRVLDEADEVVGAPQVAVIGHDLWQARFAGRPDILGSTLRVGATLHTVVGVMPEGFFFPMEEQLWLAFRHDALAYQRGQGPAGVVMGRLAEGASVQAAQNQIDLIGRRLAEEFPDTHARLQPQVLPYTSALTEIDSPEARIAIALTQLLALLLLVLACGNVGILMLARAATRTRELAIRTALGASRARIVSQLFVESLVLAILAAGVGLLALQAIVRGPDYLLAGLPYWVDFDVAPATVVLALALAVASAAIAGVVPALKATGRDVQASIQRASADGSGIRFGKGYSALIIGEVAVSVALLTFGSALLPTAFSAPAELGIQTGQYLHAAVRIPGVDATPPGVEPGAPELARRVATAHEELVRRLSAEPGLGPVAIASTLPGMSHPAPYVQVEGLDRDPAAPAPAFVVNVARVDVGYFDALDQPILHGRGFNRGDLGADRTAVIVNQGFVDRVLGGRSPLGRRLRYWTPGQEPGPWSYEIVGVVAALGMNPLDANANQGMYHAIAPGELHPIRFAVRVGSDPQGFTPRLRSIVAGIDADALVQDPMALDEVPDADRRVLAMGTYFLAFLAAIAVLLSAACLHALMAFTVTERTRECGIRTALGARPADLLSAIARRASLQLVTGIAIGAVLSGLILSRFDDLDASLLRTTNWPLTLGAIALFVMGVGLLACARPTLHLVRIRPADALKG